MNNPSSRHLTHDFPAYKGLTLRELFVLVVTTTLATFLFSIIAGAFLGWPVLAGALGFIIGFVIAILVMPGPVSRLKAGKPQGYLVKKIRLSLSGMHLCKSPYTNHQGPWQKSRRFGGRHV